MPGSWQLMMDWSCVQASTVASLLNLTRYIIAQMNAEGCSVSTRYKPAWREGSQEPLFHNPSRIHNHMECGAESFVPGANIWQASILTAFLARRHSVLLTLTDDRFVA